MACSSFACSYQLFSSKLISPHMERCMSPSIIRLTLGLALIAASSTAAAQSAPMLYGAPVSTDAAKRATAAALAVARQNNWTVAVAIVDPGGILVYFERM